MRQKDYVVLTPEGKIKAKVKRVLSRHKRIVDGYWPVPCGYGENWLDFVGLMNSGHFLAIETKKPGGKLTSRQKNTIARIQAKHGYVFVIASDEDVEELERFLKSFHEE